ncbi:MAG: hypothetical protein FWH06_08005 [Oscillospiraceae bacterium]|nr:hypothetical protein [Oscillospiraceae bacterium]
MRYRKLDENGDYMFGRRGHFHHDAAAVAQAVKTRLGLLRGEWWENTEDGLPLFQEILNTFHTTEYGADGVDLIFSERILGTKGVSEILSFDSRVDMSARSYSAVCVIRTVFGDAFNIQISGKGHEPLNITS